MMKVHVCESESENLPYNLFLELKDRLTKKLDATKFLESS
jgi:hypothetical protein